jgi:hypothetical protein
MAEAAWQSDPTGRHELRYWDGAKWTEHVADHGAQSSDAVGRDLAGNAASPLPATTQSPQASPPTHAGKPGWYADRSGKFEQRVWDGSRWTMWVRNNGGKQEVDHPGSWQQPTTAPLVALAPAADTGDNPRKRLVVVGSVLAALVLLFGTCVALAPDETDTASSVRSGNVEDRLPRASTTTKRTTTTTERPTTTAEAQEVAAPTTAAPTTAATVATTAPPPTAAPVTAAATTAPPETTAPPPPPETTTTAASSGGSVHPGSYCSPAGAEGTSENGTPMTCSTESCDGKPYDQPRWRRTTC